MGYPPNSLSNVNLPIVAFCINLMEQKANQPTLPEQNH